MPVLRKIVVQDFRNIALQELEFSPNVNCISGGNGEGKTNLLDAIYFLSMTKSAFQGPDRFNFRYGTSAFALGGTYGMDNGTVSRFSLRVEDGGDKKIRRDDKAYERISDHIGVLPVVMISPADVSLVSESGEERRRFANSVLSQMSREHLHDIQSYNRLLQQRNALLKGGSPDEGLLEILDLRMEEPAARIAEARAGFIEGLGPIVKDYYSKISGGREEVSLEYRTDLQKGRLSDMLKAGRGKDLALGYTSAGIQRDDFLFLMDGHPIRRCGSQGQQKSFLVAVKFAQYELMRKAFGFSPILLLDDLFDKLDMGRVSNLLQMVSGDGFGQIFITDSNKVRLRGLVDGITDDRAYFETEGGVFTNEQQA